MGAKKVLIVETDPVLCRILCRIVQTCGRNTCIFRTGRISEAYRIADEQDVELMIVDAMPGPDGNAGMEFIGHVRKKESYVFVPVILLSFREEDRYPAFLKLHCYGFLNKPLQIEETKGLIRDAMRYSAPEKEKRRIRFQYGCIVYSLKVTEIIYIEHKRRKMYVHTVDEVIEIPYQTCEETMQQLKGASFEVCARGKIVNLKYIQSIDRIHRRLLLKEGCGSLNVGRTYMKKMKDTLQKL